jgi:hypothetical protein
VTRDPAADPAPQPREHHDGCEGEGLYHKYEVRRTDGAGHAGAHQDCRYFVLDLSHDPAARYAALDYARQIETTRPNLAADLRQLVASLRGF